MQANQSLIDRESYLNYFYCTLDDAIKDLDELFQKEFIKIQHIIKLEEERQLEEVKELEEARKLEPEKELEKKRELEEKRAGPIVSQVYLVAPFGAKVFLPVAYFELFNLRSVATEVITVEIANVKGFQYTSSYSLGVGKITCFELNGGIIADVLRKN